MKILTRILSNCVFLILISSQCYAQIKIKCAGKNYYIPVFKDSPVKTQYPSTLERLNVLKPITESKYDIEIRAHFLSAMLSGSSTVIILKGNANEFVVETIRYNYAGNTVDSLRPKGTEVAKLGNLKYFYLVKSIKAPDILLSSLIKNHFFDFDEKAIRDSLTKAKIKVYNRSVLDGYSIGFEVKVKDHYRGFGVDPVRYPLDVKELEPIGFFDATFGGLFKLAE